MVASLGNITYLAFDVVCYSNLKEWWYLSIYLCNERQGYNETRISKIRKLMYVSIIYFNFYKTDPEEKWRDPPFVKIYL